MLIQGQLSRGKNGTEIWITGHVNFPSFQAQLSMYSTDGDAVTEKYYLACKDL
jgi:hypothetical protein